MSEPPRKRYRSCEPSDEFESMMAWYRNYPGIEHPFVPCDLLTPDYSLLEKPQLYYYLWWRRRLSEGELLQAEKGYVWLRLCELANSPDPAQGLGEVAVLKAHAAEIGMVPEDLDRMAADLCIAGGLPVPVAEHAEDDVARRMVASESLWDPSRIDEARLGALIGQRRAEEVADRPEGVKEFPEMLARAWSDEHLLGSETVLRDLFPGCAVFGTRTYLVTYDVFGDSVNGLLEDVYLYVTGKGVPSRSFLRRISDPCVKSGSAARRTENGSVRMPVSRRETDLMKIGTELFGADPPVGMKRSGSASVHGPDGPIPSYVPSGSNRPDYRTLSDAQRRFYAAWSSEADSGRHHDADTGYVWMRLCSLVNSVNDPRSVLVCLADMHRAYRDGPSSSLIRRTCMDFALKNRLPIPDPTLADGDDEACMVMQQYLGGCMDAKPDKEVLLRIAGLLGTDADRAFDPTMEETMRRTLMNASSLMLRNTGKDAPSLCRKSIHERRLYEGLAYYRSDRDSLVLAIKFADFAKDEEMRRSFRELAEYIVEESERIAHGQPREPIKVFGMDEEKLVEYLLTGSVADRKPSGRAPKRIKLDKDAISQAESDLRDVTAMMGVEEEDERETFAEEGKADYSPSDDPWKDFAAGLDDGMREYLSKSSSGCAADLRAEKAINSLAMDTVGDIVVQDGRIVEDYIGDVLEAIGRGSD